MKVKFIYAIFVYAECLQEYMPYRYYSTRKLAESTLKVLRFECPSNDFKIRRLSLFTDK